MHFGAIFALSLRVGLVEKIPEETFVGGIDDGVCVAAEIGKIKAYHWKVTMRGSSRRFDRLNAAAVQEEESAGRVLHHFAGLREDSGVLLGIAPVVDENAKHDAVRRRPAM